ncbi:TRAP transporter substrate-binding protein, partial [Chloroflexota bacterium]
LQYGGAADWNIAYLPFFWDSMEHSKSFLEHPDGGGKMLAGLEAFNIKGLTMLPDSYWTVDFTKDTPLDNLASVAGLKAAATGGLIQTAWEVRGATPVFMYPQEALQNYETGMVDTFANSVGAAVVQKQYEGSTYGLLYSPIVAATQTCVMNLDTWDSLSSGIQSVIENMVIPELEAYAWETVPAGEQAAIEVLKANLIVKTATLLEQQAVWQQVSAQAGDTLAYINADLITLADSLR